MLRLISYARNAEYSAHVLLVYLHPIVKGLRGLFSIGKGSQAYRAFSYSLAALWLAFPYKDYYRKDFKERFFLFRFLCSATVPRRSFFKAFPTAHTRPSHRRVRLTSHINHVSLVVVVAAAVPSAAVCWLLVSC